MADPIQLKVGDPVWVYDENRRVYRGHMVIWREHWVGREVVGENRVAFFIGHHGTFKPERIRSGEWYRRVEKADLRTGKFPWWLARSQLEVDRRAWAHDVITPLIEKLRACDVARLAAVAALVAPELALPEELSIVGELWELGQ